MANHNLEVKRVEMCILGLRSLVLLIVTICCTHNSNAAPLDNDSFQTLRNQLWACGLPAQSFYYQFGSGSAPPQSTFGTACLSRFQEAPKSHDGNTNEEIIENLKIEACQHFPDYVFRNCDPKQPPDYNKLEKFYSDFRQAGASDSELCTAVGSLIGIPNLAPEFCVAICGDSSGPFYPLCMAHAFIVRITAQMNTGPAAAPEPNKDPATGELHVPSLSDTNNLNPAPGELPVPSLSDTANSPDATNIDTNGQPGEGKETGPDVDAPAVHEALSGPSDPFKPMEGGDGKAAGAEGPPGGVPGLGDQKTGDVLLSQTKPADGIDPPIGATDKLLPGISSPGINSDGKMPLGVNTDTVPNNPPNGALGAPSETYNPNNNIHPGYKNGLPQSNPPGNGGLPYDVPGNTYDPNNPNALSGPLSGGIGGPNTFSGNPPQPGDANPLNVPNNPPGYINDPNNPPGYNPAQNPLSNTGMGPGSGLPFDNSLNVAPPQAQPNGDQPPLDKPQSGYPGYSPGLVGNGGQPPQDKPQTSFPGPAQTVGAGGVLPPLDKSQPGYLGPDQTDNVNQPPQGEPITSNIDPEQTGNEALPPKDTDSTIDSDNVNEPPGNENGDVGNYDNNDQTGDNDDHYNPGNEDVNQDVGNYDITDQTGDEGDQPFDNPGEDGKITPEEKTTTDSEVYDESSSEDEGVDVILSSHDEENNDYGDQAEYDAEKVELEEEAIEEAYKQQEKEYLDGNELQHGQPDEQQNEDLNENENNWNKFQQGKKPLLNQQQEQEAMYKLEEESSSSHFLAYSLTAIILIMATYLLYHNKQKIIAIIIEGKNPGGRRRRGDGYAKLENVSEAMPSLQQQSTKDYTF